MVIFLPFLSLSVFFPIICLLLLMKGAADDSSDGGKEGKGERTNDLPHREVVTLVALRNLVLDLGRSLLVGDDAGGDGLGEERDDGGTKKDLNEDALAAREGASGAALLLGVGGGLLEHAIAALGAGLEEDHRGVEGGADARVGVDGGAAEEVVKDRHLDVGPLHVGLNLMIDLVGVIERAGDHRNPKGVDGDVDGALAEAEERVLGSGHCV